jgi:hypothetical protein
MAGMIVHAGELLNHARDPGESPQVCGKPVRAGSPAEGTIQAVQVGGVQSRFPSGAPGAAQCGGAAMTPGLVPATDTLSAHLQGARDGRHDLARGKQARRPLAAQFQGMEVSAWGYIGVHAPIINEGAENVTLFCEIH